MPRSIGGCGGKDPRSASCSSGFVRVRRVRVRAIEFEGNRFYKDRFLRRQVIARLRASLGEQGVFRRVSDEEVSDLGVAGEGFERWRPAPRSHPTARANPKEVFVAEVYQEALNTLP